MVGLLTSNVLHLAFSSPAVPQGTKSDNGTEKDGAREKLSRWLQRPGRPGISPEFPSIKDVATL